mmetsp:Transcript_82964/g.213767  ORF Transcript_82964/g.213767 Transcript_82964/m.213767 type:complete len:124 (-) Transcript_82964:640-1011(-)
MLGSGGWQSDWRRRHITQISWTCVLEQCVFVRVIVQPTSPHGARPKYWRALVARHRTEGKRRSIAPTVRTTRLALEVAVVLGDTIAPQAFGQATETSQPWPEPIIKGQTTSDSMTSDKGKLVP